MEERVGEGKEGKESREGEEEVGREGGGRKREGTEGEFGSAKQNHFTSCDLITVANQGCSVLSVFVCNSSCLCDG